MASTLRAIKSAANPADARWAKRKLPRTPFDPNLEAVAVVVGARG
jgi:hypothetical protein